MVQYCRARPCALGQPYDAVILIDTVPPDGCPGRLQLLEPDINADETAAFDSHHVDPLAVLKLARRIGELPSQIFLVGCEPMDGTNSESMSMNLSEPVAAAVDKAVEVVLMLVRLLLSERKPDMDGVLEVKVGEKNEFPK